MPENPLQRIMKAAGPMPLAKFPNCAQDDELWMMVGNRWHVAWFICDPKHWIKTANKRLRDAPGSGRCRIKVTENFVIDCRLPIDKHVGAVLPDAPNGVAKVVIQGVSNTGIISVRPITSRPDFTDWNKYFNEWEHCGEILVGSEGDRGYGHLELTERDDRERPDKLAAFMLLGSTSVDHLNQILRARTSPAIEGRSTLTFRQLGDKTIGGPNPLEKVTFLYQSELSGTNPACEMLYGVVDGDEIVLETSVTKSYKKPKP